MNRMGSGNLYSEGGFPDLDADVRSNYIMNTTLLGVEKADAILLIGSNPRLEAPVFNARYAPCVCCTSVSSQSRLATCSWVAVLLLLEVCWLHVLLSGLGHSHLKFEWDNLLANVGVANAVQHI